MHLFHVSLVDVSHAVHTGFQCADAATADVWVTIPPADVCLSWVADVVVVDEQEETCQAK